MITRILIVEHEHHWVDKIRNTVIAALDGLREDEVQVCATPQEAIGILRAEPRCELIVSDVFFGDGRFVADLAELRASRSIPLILLSAHATVADISELAGLLELRGVVHKNDFRENAFATLVQCQIRGRFRRDPDRVFSWIHLSDLHFGAGSHTHRFDQKAVCRAIANDVVHCPRPDAVFVTGDIAFRAAPAEYEQAAEFFERIAHAAGVDRRNFFFVPGNHDVDRHVADGDAIHSYHEVVRSDGYKKLDDFLANEDIRTKLSEKLTAYAGFIEKWFPDHPKGREAGIDWVQLAARGEADRTRIHIVGLSSVWVSDSHDGKVSGTHAFQPNLVVSRHQLEGALGRDDPKAIWLVLSHHPPTWLTTPSQRDLRQYLARKRHIHLCGHVHLKSAKLALGLGDARAELLFVAGATHGDEAAKDRAEHGYAWGMLRHSAGAWEAGWAPRVYVPELDRARADHNRYDLDEDGFAWRDTHWR